MQHLQKTSMHCTNPESPAALELHAMHEHPLVRLASDKARLVHGGIKIRGAADILAVLDAVSPVLLVELPDFSWQEEATSQHSSIYLPSQSLSSRYACTASFTHCGGSVLKFSNLRRVVQDIHPEPQPL